MTWVASLAGFAACRLLVLLVDFVDWLSCFCYLLWLLVAFGFNYLRFGCLGVPRLGWFVYYSFLVGSLIACWFGFCWCRFDCCFA